MSKGMTMNEPGHSLVGKRDSTCDLLVTFYLCLS